MISIRRLDRDFHAQRYEALLAAILTHRGLEVPSSLRLRLASHPACALSLALQRVAELSFGPNTILNDMLETLLNMQQSDGSIEGDPLPTACLAHALDHLLREGLGHMHPKLEQAHEKAILAMSHMQESTVGREPWQDPQQIGFRSSDDRSMEDRAAVGAFILLLLMRDAEFRQQVDYTPLLDWLTDHQDELDPMVNLLWQAATLDLAPPRRVQRLRQALAA